MNIFQRVRVMLVSSKVTACQAPWGGMTWILPHTHARTRTLQQYIAGQDGLFNTILKVTFSCSKFYRSLT